MRKIIHIHSDLKHIKTTNLFKKIDKVENTIILITNEKITEEQNVYGSLLYDNDLKSLKKIINICNNYDIAVFYNLDFNKSYIANRVDKKVKTIWRFFGTELYSRIPKTVLSAQTLPYAFSENKNSIGNLYRKLRLKLWELKTYNTTIEYDFKKSCRKINYFLGLSFLEYEFLKKHFKYLPEYLSYPYSFDKKIYSSYPKNKVDRIIIGNNRSPYNNHLEIIDFIRDKVKDSNVEFLFLFNYAGHPDYNKAVYEASKDLNNANFQEEFLPYNDFQSLYSDSKALVINGYRQMAMANIYQAFRSGLKVYLNEKNVMMKFFMEEGFFVFSVDDLADDILNNNYTLDINHYQNNLSKMIELSNKYPLSIFEETLNQ